MVVFDLEKTEYLKAYEIQKHILEDVALGHYPEGALLLCEHPDVFTSGRRKSEKSLCSEITCVEVERGGEVTFHNPGQLVCYPILPIKAWDVSVQSHLRNLEQILIDVLTEFMLGAQIKPGYTGVWVDRGLRKIASIGVSCKKGVSFHGLALNVNNSLDGFLKINPCGLEGRVMTSMEKELGFKVSFKEVKNLVINRFLSYRQSRVITNRVDREIMSSSIESRSRLEALVEL